MPLVAPPKRPAHTRKRQAKHHRRSKRYIKPYLPYLPMLAIVGTGGLVNAVWAASSSVAMAAPAANTLGQTRLAVMTGQRSNTLIYIVLAVTFAAFAILLLSHWYRFHRLLNRGEAFVVSHPWFDVGLVTIITAGVVLTRT